MKYRIGFLLSYFFLAHILPKIVPISVFQVSILMLLFVLSLIMVNRQYLSKQISQTNIHDSVIYFVLPTILMIGFGIFKSLVLFPIGSDSDNILIQKNWELQVLLVVIIGPLSEELVFRYTMITLDNKKRIVSLSLLSAIFFIFFHLNSTGNSIGSIISVILLSSTLTFSYVKTGNLIYPVLIHILYNSFIVSAGFIESL